MPNLSKGCVSRWFLITHTICKLYLSFTRSWIDQLSPATLVLNFSFTSSSCYFLSHRHYIFFRLYFYQILFKIILSPSLVLILILYHYNIPQIWEILHIQLWASQETKNMFSLLQYNIPCIYYNFSYFSCSDLILILRY